MIIKTIINLHLSWQLMFDFVLDLKYWYKQLLNLKKVRSKYL